MKITRYRSIPSFRKGHQQFAGRNTSGRITVRHRGKGHKQSLRSVTWRPRSSTGIVVGFEYDPQRTVPLAKIYHPDTQSSGNASPYSYHIAAEKAKPLQKLNFSTKNPSQQGDYAKLAVYEPGDFIHSVELYPGQGPSVARAAGSFCQVRSSVSANVKYIENASASGENSIKSQYVKVRLPSGSQRLISSKASAFYGIPQSNGFHQRPRQKAGRNRWYGWRPSVRGVARNPVDHPHGGGQGKTSGGRPSVTFKAWPTKGQPTRSPKRKNSRILVVRKKKN